MPYLLPCSLCSRFNLPCSPDCLYAPFFPNHSVNLAKHVIIVFNLDYILTTLLLLQNNHHYPQPSSTIRFMKYLLAETPLRLFDPVIGSLQSMRNYVNHRDSEINELRRELNVAMANQPQVLTIEEGSANSGNLPPPPPL